MRTLPLLSTAVLLLASAPLAAAHGAPAEAEPAKRLLADWTDDCGGDGGTATGSCRGSDDLIALDIKEMYDGTQNVLVFRFTMDKGKSYPITDALTLTTPGGPKTLAIRTTDDAGFTATGGFDSVGPAKPLNDGTRFTVDATVSFASLGVAPGDKITGFSVSSNGAAGAGDFMPGGCHNTLGDCVDTGQSSGQYVAGNNPGSFTLRDPAATYATLDGPSGTQTAVAGKDLPSPIQIDLKNLLHRTPQAITIKAEGADGVTAGFHVGGSGMDMMAYKPSVDVTLPGDGTTILHLNLHGDRAGASGTLTITATTDQGGRTQLAIPYMVSDAALPPQTTTDSGGGGKHSPAPAMALTGLLLLGLALRRRRD
jgi:hypothetical protein